MTNVLYNERTLEEIMRYGMIAGMLNAQQEKTGQIDTDKVQEIYNKVSVKKLN